LAQSHVPVARVFHLCEDREVMGSMFYLMEFCDGNIHWDARLENIGSNQQRQAMYLEIVQVLAAIHSVDLEQTGLSDYGKPGNYFQRQLNRWAAQYRASELEPIPEMDKLIDWLGQALPEDDGKVSLVHGDYRLDNLMFSSDNKKVTAVLDWELSTLGHPYADLAYMCMGLRLPPTDKGASGLMGIDRSSLGIPSEEELIAQYCQQMGIKKIDHWPFYLAFSFFRLAAIVQGVAKRASMGNASNKASAGAGAMVQPLAAMALEITAMS